jgi:very-short-patch-repair endonuclease
MRRINDAEELLAIHLKERGFLANREFHFAPKRKWRVDFFLPTVWMAVEIEGGAHINGRHNRAAGFVGDMEKYNALTKQGIALLRYTPEQVLDGSAVADIVDAIKTLRGETP